MNAFCEQYNFSQCRFTPLSCLVAGGTLKVKHARSFSAARRNQKFRKSHPIYRVRRTISKSRQLACIHTMHYVLGLQAYHYVGTPACALEISRTHNSQ